MPDLSNLKESDINTQLEQLNAEIDAKNEQINSIKNGSEINELKRKISDIELQIANVKNEHEQNKQNELHKLKMRLQEEESNHQILQGDVKHHIQRKNSNDEQIKNYERQMNNLRDEYKRNQELFNEINAQEFQHDDECICPTCQQELPQEEIDKAIAQFNENKANKLAEIKERQEEINQEGIALKEKVEKLKTENESVQGEIDRITEIGKKKVEEIDLLKKKIKKAESEVTPVEENEQYMNLKEEKQSLIEKIEYLETDVNESIFAIDVEIEKLQEQQRSLQIELAKFVQVEHSKKRIEELQQEERSLAAEFEELEHQLYLTEEFTRTKVEMLTDNINSKFKYARFRLFEEQINGGLNEVCVVIGKNGESYENINNAYKINISLDIIKTLSKHKGEEVQISLDNAKPVTSL